MQNAPIRVIFQNSVTYINDLPLSVSSNVKLYADDTLIYRVINTSEDTTLLQENLDAVPDPMG